MVDREKQYPLMIVQLLLLKKERSGACWCFSEIFFQVLGPANGGGGTPGR